MGKKYRGDGGGNGAGERKRRSTGAGERKRRNNDKMKHRDEQLCCFLCNA
jgi:hypothetical protein